MDVVGIFLGDSAYGSMRNSVYRDFEIFPYGTLENNKNSTIKDSYSKVQEKCQKNKEQKIAKQTCPFCKEHKKRPLISYLRKRDMLKNNEKIYEENEELEEHILNEHKEEKQEKQEEKLNPIKKSKNNYNVIIEEDEDAENFKDIIKK